MPSGKVFACRLGMSHAGNICHPIIFGNASIEIGSEDLCCFDIETHVAGRRALRPSIRIGPHFQSEEILLALHTFFDPPLEKGVRRRAFDLRRFECDIAEGLIESSRLCEQLLDERPHGGFPVT